MASRAHSARKSVSSELLDLDKDPALASAATLPSEHNRSTTAPPHTIGRYLVVRPLGMGGMGVVYSAYDEELDRRVAVKLLQPHGFAPLGESALRRLRREAQALAKLSHPNVVQIYDVGEFRGQLFLAMEYVRGKTLREWLCLRVRDLREVVDVFLQAGRGLAAAHDEGLVHRDFKPDNVMVGDDGRVRVLDFGVVRSDAIDSEQADAAATSRSSEAGSTPSSQLTEAGMLIGTPAYMAPEQFASQRTDKRTDIFGFCVTLYEALYGCRPFTGDNVYALRAAVLAGDVEPSTDDRNVPARIRRLLLRGLQPDPLNRYQTMDELLRELAYDPSAKRRRNLFTALITLAVVAVTVGALWMTQLPALPSCDAASAELTEFYNPARRAQLGAGIRLSNVPLVESTWVRVAPLLDDYAAAWSAARVDACEAHREGRQSPRLFDLRTACLDQRRAGFEALIEVIENADDSTVPKLVEAALALPRLESCADTEALTAAIPPPADAAIAATVQRLREHLAEVKAYESAGDFQRASALVDALEADVDALDYAPIKVEVLLRRGTLAMWQFQLEAADEALATAFYAALEVGHDTAAADAISRRIYIQSNLAPHSRTEMTRLGDALIERTRGDKALVATYYNNVGVLAKEAGEASAARRAYQESLLIKRALYGEVHVEVGYTLSNLASLDIDEGFYARATERYIEAAAIFREALGPQHFQTGALLSNLANAHARSGRWQEAAAAYKAMDEVFSVFPDVWSEMGPYILPDRGDFHLECRRIGDAERDYIETLRLLGATPDTEAPPATRAHIGLARVAAHRNDWAELERQIAHLKPILEAETPRSPRLAADALELKAVLAGEGGEENGEEDVDEVRAIHERALRIRVQSTSEDSPGRTRALLTYASALLTLQRHEDALRQLTAAESIISRSLSLGSPERWLYAEIVGQEALLRGEMDDAVIHLREAVDLRQAASDEEDFELALARFNLARALLDTGETKEARALGLKALESLQMWGEGWKPETAEVSSWLSKVPNPDVRDP